ncbi:alpha/beta-hydrolase [Sodiomyces alkalinus F11]|uniref:Alpha/beta-hydrolase n=1 Tax=Sodiomyces alkalinus (strain CBS 110278 / VKM F-3762 / F11) TaxID=1314773 RepID=A0A3N2PSQ9_SODAK|nr:alpha/beta-hydrolase [Sodiomyces alkalinus F11]ROT37454.1 alpha/beta-hydrolase [Sodiomyces alkalinus F11]
MSDSSRLADSLRVTSRSFDTNTGAEPAAISVPTSPFSVALTFAVESVSHLSNIQLLLPSPDRLSLITTTAVTTLVVFFIVRYVLYPKWGRAIPSPLRASFPDVPPDAIKSQVYHPDVLPGARDVTTPYGTIRVYEWGNVNGPKVLLVHGISTPCITLAPLARALADKGCRVLTFDLFGRGFSDGVGDLPHDDRLYASNILLALASSPLPWTGNHAFHLVGYSLGGALAASFAAGFPRLPASLVLLAPAGLIRTADFGTIARLTFRSGLVPERLLALATKSRLQRPIAASSKRKPTQADSLRDELSSSSPTAKVADVVASETKGPEGTPTLPLERRVDEYVRWMVTHHAGFVPAFMSCIRHAPLTDQHPTWASLGRLLSPGRIAVLLARHDEIVNCEAYEREGRPLLGDVDKVHWGVLDGNHDFVMTHVEDIMAQLDSFWGLVRKERI